MLQGKMHKQGTQSARKCMQFFFLFLNELIKDLIVSLKYLINTLIN